MKKLQDKWIITKMPYKRREGQFVLSAHFLDGKAERFNVEDIEHASLLGNIYVGKVSKVVKNIEAAFVEIGHKQMCYCPLKENPNPIFVKEKKGKALCAGDELLVQVTKESMKTKEPVVSTNLNFPGRYVALAAGPSQVSVSAKIPSGEKERFQKLLAPFLAEGYGFIVRTNARFCDEELLLSETRRLIQEYEKLLSIGSHRPCFSCLKKNPPSYCKNLMDMQIAEETEIITDEQELFTEMEAFLREHQPEHVGRLSFYEDKLLPLYKLYSLETGLEDALKGRVWLKSGGYLVIQPTEALTVIDVNTGKFDGKKKKEDTFLKINLEAAREIARQLKLRNLSGMILVDFINMEVKEHEETLLHTLREALKKDSVKTALVDITDLGLVELTRQKKQRPLYEQLGESCPCCHGTGYLY